LSPHSSFLTSFTSFPKSLFPMNRRVAPPLLYFPKVVFFFFFFFGAMGGLLGGFVVFTSSRKTLCQSPDRFIHRFPFAPPLFSRRLQPLPFWKLCPTSRVPRIFAKRSPLLLTDRIFLSPSSPLFTFHSLPAHCLQSLEFLRSFSSPGKRSALLCQNSSPPFPFWDLPGFRMGLLATSHPNIHQYSGAQKQRGTFLAHHMFPFP